MINLRFRIVCDGAETLANVKTWFSAVLTPTEALAGSTHWGAPFLPVPLTRGKWVQERGAAIYSDENQALLLEGYIEDISEHVSAEQELRQTGERFRLGTQATRDVVWD
jgi:PAS domain-containing protein